jgi:DNA polymerase-3 subunit gamma/tau
MSQYQVLARRWRPVTFEAVMGQGPIVRTLQNALARQRIAHAYLFTGPRGVGKTTTARLLAMGLNCERAGEGGPVVCAACEPCREIVAGRALDVVEIDAASNRGIDEVRTLRENARYAPARGRRKVYIIDEVHMLTEPAFNALLKTLEEPPAHIVFVLATTEPRELPATILSRCQRFDFRPIAASEIAAGLARILDEETTRSGEASAVEPDALALIATAADGSLRDALSLLDTALAYGEGRVTARSVQELLGSGGLEAAAGLAEALVRRDAAEALGRIDRVAAEGQDVGLLCQDAMELLRRALLAAVHGGTPAGAGAAEAERLARLGATGTEELLLLVKGLLDAEAEMRQSPHPRVDLEVAVVRLCHRPAVQAIEAVLERLERAEGELRGYGPAVPAPPQQADLLAPPAAPPPLSRPPVPAPPGRPAAPTARPPAAAPPRSSGPGAPDGGAPAPRRPEAAPSAASPPRGPAAAGSGDVWERIVAEITRLRPTLGHKLSDGTVLADEGTRLTVSLPNGDTLLQDMLRQYRQQIVETARRVRPDLRDIQFTSATAAAGTSGGAAEHPAVQAAVELFDGEITAVRPTSGADRREAAEPGDSARQRGEGT